MTLRRGSVRIGWFRSVTGAITGALFGVILFFATAGLLWWNEGRLDLANLARTAAVAPADRVDGALDQHLVSVTALPSTDRPVTDPTFLRALDAIALARRAEMYAWIERRDGSRYDYSRAWTASPPDSHRFHDPRGHENPAMRYRSERFASATARIGAYRFSPVDATLPSGDTLALTADLLRSDAPDGARIEGDWVFIGRGSFATPAVGDTRLGYRIYRGGGLATLFGAQQRDAVTTHHEGTTRFYRLLTGSRDAAIGTLALEHRIITWMLRVLGFLFIWVAFNMALAPISAMFDLIPPLGRATRSLVASLTLPPAFFVTAAIVIIAAIAHSPLFVTLFVACGIVAFTVWIARKIS